VSLFNDHIHERRLAVVQMAANGHIANQVWIVHHIGEIFFAVQRFRQVLLDFGEVLLLQRLHNRLCEKLCIFFLH
jgi:hypothetical protein